MRATATSATNSSALFQVRTAPPAVELDELSTGVGPLPISAASTAASDADTMQCAHGYSGCIGVSMNGVHVALGRSHDLLDQWPVTVVLLDPFSGRPWPASRRLRRLSARRQHCPLHASCLPR